MPEEVVAVHVNRAETGSIEVTHPDVETRDPLVLRVKNHGDPVHVHCRLDGDVAAVAETSGANYFVPADRTVDVTIAIQPGERDVTGTIELSTRFGAQSASISLTVSGGPRPVDVDERLSKPSRPEPTRTEPARPGIHESIRPQAATVGLVALAVVAIGIAVAAAVVVGGTVAAVATGIVGVGIAVAIGLLWRSPEPVQPT